MKKILAFVCLIIMIISIMAPSLAMDSGTGYSPTYTCPKCGGYLNIRRGEWHSVPGDFVTINGITYIQHYESREVNKWCTSCVYCKQRFERRKTWLELAWTH